MNGFYYFLLLIIVVCFVLFYRLIRLRPRTKSQVYTNSANHSYTHFEEGPEFHIQTLEAEKQSTPWRQGMRSLGKRMQQWDVLRIYFIHGTFAGFDPFDGLPILNSLHPHLADRVEMMLKKRHQKKQAIGRDYGNFPPQYVHIFNSAIGPDIICSRFSWSSGNHHLARVRAALDLLSELYKAHLQPNQRILFIAHSHGGQLLALLTRLLLDADFLIQLQKYLPTTEFHWEELYESLTRLKDVSLDFVTMGMPPRYTFFPHPKIRLLHLINHRGPHPTHDLFHGIMQTKGGDAIQQWGVTGSDSLASTAQDRLLNAKLDPLLDVGQNWKLWKQRVQRGHRLCSQGYSYLIDYQDDSQWLPNCAQSLFGHAVYTRYKCMYFNTQLIVRHFYQK